MSRRPARSRLASTSNSRWYQTALWKDVTSPLRSTYSCSYDYGGDYVIHVPVERANGLLRGTYQFNTDHRVFVEALASRCRRRAVNHRPRQAGQRRTGPQ